MTIPLKKDKKSWPFRSWMEGRKKHQGSFCRFKVSLLYFVSRFLMRIVRCIFESLHEYLSGQPISASQRLKILMTCFQPPGSMKQRHENQAFRFTQLGSFCSEPKTNLPILNPGWPLHPAPVTNLCGPSPASPIALLYPRN